MGTFVGCVILKWKTSVIGLENIFLAFTSVEIYCLRH